MRQAQLSLFTTPTAAASYAALYPQARSRIGVLENGYDEASFESASSTLPPDRPALQPDTVTLLHSGIVYPAERDPTQLFVAMRLLLDRREIAPGNFKVRFRAPAHGALLRQLGAQHGVSDLIEVCPPIPYRDALGEMLCADALIVLQAANCNAQIPAKIYEYLRAQRPILCLSDPAGDTARVVCEAGIDAVARLDDASEIAQLLSRFLADHRDGKLKRYTATQGAVEAASRLGRTRQLAADLDALTQEG